MFREWNQNDLDLFAKAKISKATLDLFHCKPLTVFEIRKENKTMRIPCPEFSPAYAYSFPSGHYKIYQPFADPRYKWTSNLSAEADIFGFELVPKECDHLFIIGGNRDAMSFYENIGHPVIALPSESANIPDLILNCLQRCAKNIWVFYDNDKQGYRKADRFNEMYDFKSLNHILNEFNVKDFSQFMEEKSMYLNEFNFLLNKNINV
jgi:hypothetical protein